MEHGNGKRQQERRKANELEESHTDIAVLSFSSTKGDLNERERISPFGEWDNQAKSRFGAGSAGLGFSRVDRNQLGLDAWTVGE